MKPFIFNEQEYTDLNTLGLAFVEQYDLALQCIKEKPFIQFFKKFKQHKKKIKSIFYQSKYLQSALSMIIYEITDEHIFYVGHHRYDSIKEILPDIKKNPALIYFIEDHGFSNTLLSTLEDEKLKNDLIALEENYKDEVAIDFIEGYYQTDSIEPLLERIKKLPESKNSFKDALEVFSSLEVQKALAYKYSLKEVMDIRKKKCPVFLSILLTKDEMEGGFSILENAFYHHLLKTYKKYKFKKKEGKSALTKIKSVKKKFKKYAKLSSNAQVKLEEELYELYIHWVNLYYLDRVVIKDENLKPLVPYCNTFIPAVVQEECHYEIEERTEEFEAKIPAEYDLNAFYKSLKTHKNFAIWSIVISLLSFVLYFVFVFLDPVRKSIVDLLNNLFKSEAQLPEQGISKAANPLFFVGVGLAIAIAIFILVLRGIEHKKYMGLCRLGYYRKNQDKLKEKEVLEFEKLTLNEEKYAKQIDRYYRFYGGVGMAGLSLCVVITMLGILYAVSIAFDATWPDKISHLFSSQIYFLLLAPVLCLLLSILRHKKTAWSVIFTQIISIAAAIGILFLPM